MAEEQEQEQEEGQQQIISVSYRSAQFRYAFDDEETLVDFADTIAQDFGIELHRLKLLVTPKPGLVKEPFPQVLLRDVVALGRYKVLAIGSSTKEIDAINSAVAKGRRMVLRGGRGTTTTTPKAAVYRDSRKIQEEAQYTFHTIRPLPYLPNPEKSARFLERLRDDPGIKASMRAHKFSVPLLTEMNPAEHTTHESRTLGLNRNKGEVIELRLRTDAYDGYRDYKVIRKTLCHELAHCVWGDHDRNFWNLTNQIEQEVERADWKHGGKTLGNEEFYNPGDDGGESEHMDHGGWTGGEFVLGGSGQARGGGDDDGGNEGLSRREILAKAAMSRLEKQKAIGTGASASGAQEKSGPEGSKPGGTS